MVVTKLPKLSSQEHGIALYNNVPGVSVSSDAGVGDTAASTWGDDNAVAVSRNSDDVVNMPSLVLPSVSLHYHGGN